MDLITNGKDAVQSLEHTTYDLLLMDCQMPEMDGYEATAEIRNTGSKVLDRKIPVIALTGHALDGDMEKCINAGMDDYLSKPVKSLELYDMIDKWFFSHVRFMKKHIHAKPESTEEEVFDLSILTESPAEDKDLIGIILKDFCNYIPDKISALKKAYHTGDSSSVQHQAHTIKGSTANVGAVSLQKIAHQIEVAGEAGDLKGVDLLLSQFDDGLVEFKKAIARL